MKFTTDQMIRRLTDLTDPVRVSVLQAMKEHDIDIENTSEFEVSVAVNGKPINSEAFFDAYRNAFDALAHKAAFQLVESKMGDVIGAMTKLQDDIHFLRQEHFGDDE